MASSLISNTNQVYFASVLAMDNAGMVAMFEALVTSVLNGFLGCLSDIYEAALVEFFQNASVRDGQVISTVQGKLVEISEEVFAMTFLLSVEGLMDLNEVPKDLAFDARSFSLLMAVSFDAVTDERFFMMTAMYGGIKVNWGRLLFNIFKDMVTPGSRQAKGYAVQISLDAEPIQTVDPTSSMPVVHPLAPKRKAPKRKLRLTAGSDDESVAKEQAVEDVVLQQETTTSVDDVDNIILRVIAESTQIESGVMEPEVTGEIVTGTDFEEQVEPRSEDIIVETSDESMYIEDLLKQIPGDALLPSVLAVEPTRIKKVPLEDLMFTSSVTTQSPSLSLGELLATPINNQADATSE
ncbi:hypothetical protein F511_39327 [Dorcoceras hygrometricum]|uniref:Splicing factor 3B subunit 1-like n=1 Tax=Dorcoceras hygrometricum TaxID=472368 RepID=A0A2Z7C6U6_9LAMI|nr:hypothetical protein F511_39327 [Dorcoceras hygrometricum]